MDARRILLERLIDHAPMFPPARLPLPEALEDHRAARASDESWMLARFVCPASTLGELPDGLDVSVVLDHGALEDLLDRPDVAAIEVPLPEPGLVRGFPHIDKDVFFQLPYSTDWEEAADAIAAHPRGAAKVRCGGESIPTTEQLARVIRACRDADVPFKATAGLHHPVRRHGEHGFLNLLAAAASDDVEAMLASEDPEELLAVDARRAREALRSIGSCSFWEPVDELKALGVLPL